MVSGEVRIKINTVEPTYLETHGKQKIEIKSFRVIDVSNAVKFFKKF